MWTLVQRVLFSITLASRDLEAFVFWAALASAVLFFSVVVPKTTPFWEAVPQYATIVVFLCVTAVVGRWLYGMRCRRPRMYGRAEVVVGLILAVYIQNEMLGRSVAGANAFFTTIGALYIIVRGYDNIYRSYASGTSEITKWNKRFFGRNTDAKL